MKTRVCILLLALCVCGSGFVLADDVDGSYRLAKPAQYKNEKEPLPSPLWGRGWPRRAGPGEGVATEFSEPADPNVPDSPLAPHTFEFEYPGFPPAFVTVRGYPYNDDPYDSAVDYFGAYHSGFDLWSSVEYGGSTAYTEVSHGWIVSVASEPSTLALFIAAFWFLCALGVRRLYARRASAQNPKSKAQNGPLSPGA
jgi:hypothetical protein